MKRGRKTKRGKKFPYWLIWLAIAIIFTVIISVLVIVKPVKNQTNEGPDVTSEQCVALGGTVIGPISDDPSKIGTSKMCKSEDDFLGYLTDLKCLCVCCRE